MILGAAAVGAVGFANTEDTGRRLFVVLKSQDLLRVGIG